MRLRTKQEARRVATGPESATAPLHRKDYSLRESFQAQLPTGALTAPNLTPKPAPDLAAGRSF